MLVLSGALLAVALISVPWLGTSEGRGAAVGAMLWTIVLGAAIGSTLWWIGRKANDYLGRREALLLVALSWLLGAVLAGMPYWLWANSQAAGDHPFRSIAACYFEAMSGLTTTGATVLSDVSGLPEPLLLWRALTQWLGGLGIVVLFVAVLPTVGVGGKKLFQVEATGPKAEGVRPRIGETARLLWLIYVGLTVVEIILLRLLDMTMFDAVCHTLTNVASGGFSTANASVGHYNSAAIDVTVMCFMLLAGVNFGLYYHLVRRNFRTVGRDPELRLYIGITIIAAIIVVASIYGSRIATTVPDQSIEQASLFQSLRYGLFQVITAHTGTGFCTADFDQWPFIAKAVLLILMFIGGSAGSTSGGLKVIRCLIVFKVMVAEIERIFRPNVVRTVRVGRLVVDNELRLGTLVYVLGILLLFMAGTLALLVLEADVDFTTAATASISTLNNIGPGLAQVGAVENYGHFNAASMVVMSLLMALGRLEVYAIFVLLHVNFWRRQ